ncbi:MAG: DNA-formamidopyrimidine glycosylase family protein [Candidatus Thorarchaeota archaeon]
MPELPELEAIAQRLDEVLMGKAITWLRVNSYIPIHGTEIDDFERRPRGLHFTSFRADGKFLLMGLDDSLEIVINPMLTGRFVYAKGRKAPTKTVIFTIRTESGTLFYNDRKRMSRVYLVETGDYSGVAGFENRGPSALDDTLTLDVFKKRIKKHRGQIKKVLRNQHFVKGIGNAYADEILLYAGILPFRRKSTLSEDEIGRLYEAMRKVMSRYRDLVAKRKLSDFGSEKRDFLMIHGKGGDICPLCGGRVSEVKANRFKTNYCQQCQH